jgi:hypothetical protein
VVKNHGKTNILILFDAIPVRDQYFTCERRDLLPGVGHGAIR